MTSITDNQDLYWVFFTMFSQVTVWFCIILACVASIAPDVVLKVIETFIERKKINKLNEIEETRKHKIVQQNQYNYPNKEIALIRSNKIRDLTLQDNPIFVNKNFTYNNNATVIDDPGGDGTFIYTDPQVTFLN